MNEQEKLVSLPGRYQKLKSFHVAQVVSDFTVRLTVSGLAL
jgi:hypothetical protein